LLVQGDTGEEKNDDNVWKKKNSEKKEAGKISSNPHQNDSVTT